MSYAGPLPQEVGEPVSTLASRSDAEVLRHLPRPATVRMDRPVWLYIITVVTIHLAALAAFIPWLFSWTGLALAILGVPFYGLGITLGYHRLLAHRCLVVPKWLEHGIALFAQCSLQDTPAKWVTVHRMHHAFSDEQQDPHSPLVNFFWSHFDWLFYHNTATRTIGALQKYASDILKDPFYMRFEKSYIGPAIYRSPISSATVTTRPRRAAGTTGSSASWPSARDGITIITTIPPRPRSGIAGGNSTSPTA
jgi:hypothetical protein